jgi:hypothetical protein
MRKEKRRITPYKDSKQEGFPVKSNRNVRNYATINRPGAAIRLLEKKDWILFDSEIGYMDITYGTPELELEGEGLKRVVEEKLFDLTLDNDFLGGLTQEEIGVEYSNGRIPCELNQFVEMIINCPIKEEE